MICPICGKNAEIFPYFNGATKKHHAVLKCNNDLCYFEMHISGQNDELALANLEATYNALMLGYEKGKDIP